ncbi:MAG: hypothetical protein ACLUBG_01470 [Streptococcus agalactiae]
MSETKVMALREAINVAMSEEMRKDEKVFLMGEDVGVYGGDFGTSVGMLEEFVLSAFATHQSQRRDCRFSYQSCTTGCVLSLI